MATYTRAFTALVISFLFVAACGTTVHQDPTDMVSSDGGADASIGSDDLSGADTEIDAGSDAGNDSTDVVGQDTASQEIDSADTQQCAAELEMTCYDSWKTTVPAEQCCADSALVKGWVDELTPIQWTNINSAGCDVFCSTQLDHAIPASYIPPSPDWDAVVHNGKKDAMYDGKMILYWKIYGFSVITKETDAELEMWTAQRNDSGLGFTIIKILATREQGMAKSLTISVFVCDANGVTSGNPSVDNFKRFN